MNYQHETFTLSFQKLTLEPRLCNRVKSKRSKGRSLPVKMAAPPPKELYRNDFSLGSLLNANYISINESALVRLDKIRLVAHHLKLPQLTP